MRPPRATRPPPFSTRRAQTRVAGLLLVAAGLAYGAMLRSLPTPWGTDLPPAGPRYADLRDRLDPDVATADELATLPGLGEERVNGIVNYRLRVAAIPGHDGRAFTTFDMFASVAGVGVTGNKLLRPHVYFPDDRSADPARLDVRPGR